jgi:hypothetical protein
VATYIDQRADEEQTKALAAIFSGAAGGPMAAFTPLISKNLAVSKLRQVRDRHIGVETPGAVNARGIGRGWNQPRLGSNPAMISRGTRRP